MHSRGVTPEPLHIYRQRGHKRHWIRERVAGEGGHAIDLIRDEVNLPLVAKFDAFLDHMPGIALTKWVVRVCHDEPFDRPRSAVHHLGHLSDQLGCKGFAQVVHIDEDRLHARSNIEEPVEAICSIGYVISPDSGQKQSQGVGFLTPKRAWNQNTIAGFTYVVQQSIERRSRPGRNGNMRGGDWFVRLEVVVEKSC